MGGVRGKGIVIFLCNFGRGGSGVLVHRIAGEIYALRLLQFKRLWEARPKGRPRGWGLRGRWNLSEYLMIFGDGTFKSHTI